MNYYYVKESLKYVGSQLHSHWAYKNYGLVGDSIVAFQGPCNVPISEMVDLEDVMDKANIFSENMLHFIVEHFNLQLEKTILKQRMLICIIKELVEGERGSQLIRRGDDLYLAENKLTVSIATLSPVSSLIHIGINISSQNIPVPAVGLEDLGIDPFSLGHAVMKAYIQELEDIKKSRAKVRGVL